MSLIGNPPLGKNLDHRGIADDLANAAAAVDEDVNPQTKPVDCRRSSQMLPN